MAPHIALVDREIERLLHGETEEDILLIEMPPRHGKSQHVSKWTPAWTLGRWPHKRVGVVSYEADFARLWGRKARDVFDRYVSPLAGLQLSGRQSAASDWEIEGHDGGMITAGAGGPLTGRGLDVLILDDLIKNAEEALSPTIRDKLGDWLQSTALTRLEPGGKVISIGTRWHDDDPQGRLIKGSLTDGRRIRRIRLPAIAEADDQLGRQPGEALWPMRYPLAKLEEIRRSIDAFWWSCLYQQNPSSRGREEWPASYFAESIWASHWPAGDLHSGVLAIDPSKGKDARKGDYSAIVYVGIHAGRIYVDADLDRRPPERIITDAIRMWDQHRPLGVGIEANQFQELLLGEWQRQTQARNLVVPAYGLNNQVNKQLRISRLGPYLMPENGLLQFRQSDGCRLLVQQLREFPLGQHDDGPDALEMALRLLNQLTGGNQGGEPASEYFEVVGV